MTHRNPLTTSMNRRRLLEMGAAAGLGAAALRRFDAFAQEANEQTGVDPATWNAETIRAKAGTLTVDTAADVHALVPAEYEGELDYWYVGPNEASAEVDKTIDAEFWETWKTLYPGIELEVGDNVQNLNYNDMLDKVRTAAIGQAGPDVAKMPILWGVEFAAKEQLQEITLEEFGFTAENFWPGALKSVTWNGKLYGVPTNNETMAFIWNKAQFAAAGLDPEVTARDLGRGCRLLQADQGRHRQSRLRPGRQAECRQHPLPGDAAPLGLWLRRPR